MEKGPSEIAKLTERISKDPKSKLFVPLAEEYKKTGDTEMAIHVLSEGLKNNPGYVTARSFLGRLLLETGDMDSARRELEEVVKAVPENLLAQRKLGDVHALQGNSTKALEHYKIALSLAPGDAEVATLVSELEAGLDVRPGLVQQTATPSAGPAGRPAETADFSQSAPAQAVRPVKPGQTEPAIAAPRPEAAFPPVEPKSTVKEVSGPPLGAGSTSEAKEVFEAPVLGESAVQQPKASHPAERASTQASEADAAEEIGEVEPLEEIANVEPLEEQQGDILSSGTGLLSETEGEGLIAQVSSEQGADLPNPAEEPVETVQEPLLKETEEMFTFASDQDDEASGISGEPEVGPLIAESAAEGAAESTDKSDDFSTDTLAELYIAQGFYEKAIDIYERMAADRPTSRGLREKLDRVKAMAAAEGKGAEERSSAAAPQGKHGAPEKESFRGRPAGDVSETSIARVTAPDVQEETAAELFEISEDEILSAETPDSGEEPAAWASVSEKTVPSHAGQRESGEYEEEYLNIEAELFDEHDEGTPGGEPRHLPSEDAIFGEAVEYKPEKDTEAEQDARNEAFDIFVQPPNEVKAAGKPSYTDFEPREYIPPNAVPKTAEERQQGSIPSRQPAAARKETIDRLENWLKNIMKEK